MLGLVFAVAVSAAAQGGHLRLLSHGNGIPVASTYSYAEKLTYLAAQDPTGKPFGGYTRGVSFVQADLDAGFGDDIGFFINAGQTNPTAATLDTSFKASSQNSVKFTIPSLSSAGASGQLTINFDPARIVQFGSDQFFSVQYEQAFDRYFFEHTFAGGGGWKQAILTAGDPVSAQCVNGSTVDCSQSHYNAVVLQNTFQRDIFQGYYYKLSGLTAFEEDFNSQYETPDVKFQTTDRGVSFTDDHDRYCLYSGNAAMPRAIAGCVRYSDGLVDSMDQVTGWATITLDIQLGTLTGGAGAEHFPGSHFEQYVSWNGNPAVKIQDLTLDLPAADGTHKYGKLWMLPYHTAKDDTEVHTETYTWYANFIVSEFPIPRETRQ
jgi:hypothetical protein